MDKDLLAFVSKNWYLFLALIVILALLIGTEIRRRTRGFKAVGPQEALRLLNDGQAVVLDVRSANEYHAGHLPEARNLPASDLDARIAELEKFKDKTLLVYCQTGNRSAATCARLKRQGYTVFELAGGLNAWVGANLPVSKKK